MSLSAPQRLGDEMADLEETLVPLVRSTLSEVLKAEGLVTEAMRDLIRDEIKEYMGARQTAKPSNPSAKASWQRAAFEAGWRRASRSGSGRLSEPAS